MCGGDLRKQAPPRGPHNAKEACEQVEPSTNPASESSGEPAEVRPARRRQTQKTPAGATIPVPTKGEVMAALTKTALAGKPAPRHKDAEEPAE